MKKLFILIAVITGIIAVIVGAAALIDSREMAEIKIGDIDLSRIPDGVYKGAEKYLVFTTQVTVRVKDHRITDIDVFEARGGKYVENAEKVTRNILEKQSLDVDTITGATVTSRAIIKAVENALKSTQNKTKTPSS